MPRPLALVSFLALTLAGCFPYHGQPDGSGDSDTTGGGVLSSSHSGWKDPACGACHSEDGHNTGLDPHECVACHGDNGAPDGHFGGTPCALCHVEPHGAAGFPDPDSCLTCHPG